MILSPIFIGKKYYQSISVVGCGWEIKLCPLYIVLVFIVDMYIFMHEKYLDIKSYEEISTRVSTDFFYGYSIQNGRNGEKLVVKS